MKDYVKATVIIPHSQLDTESRKHIESLEREVEKLTKEIVKERRDEKLYANSIETNKKLREFLYEMISDLKNFFDRQELDWPCCDCNEH